MAVLVSVKWSTTLTSVTFDPEIQPESVNIFSAGDTVKVLEELDDFALPPPEQGDNFRTAKFKSRVVED